MEFLFSIKYFLILLNISLFLVVGVVWAETTANPEDYEDDMNPMGGKAQRHKYPYHASIRSKKVHVCGGAIISRLFILTAANCLVKIVVKAQIKLPTSVITIQVGSARLGATNKELPIARIIGHPKHNDMENNIALVKLKMSLIYSPTIRPISVDSKDLIAEGDNVDVVGYGVRSQILRHTKLRVISNRECGEVFKGVSTKIFCVRYDDHEDGCLVPDAGDPIQYDGVLIGISGIPITACGVNAPDRLLRVAAYYDWIKENSDID